MKPVFSIITPTYKRVDNLKKLSKHLLSQKKKNFLEWVIVVEKDDFETIKFLKTIKIKKKIILNSGGLQNAFKNGAKKATGKYISFLGDDDFCLTYGDGLGDVDIGNLISFHKTHKNIATVTATHPTARFGALGLNGTKVEKFIEKPSLNVAKKLYKKNNIFWNSGIFLFK